MTETTVFPPLVKTIQVPWTPEAAFKRFTEDLGLWWPLRSHSIYGDLSATCGFEPRVGGRIFEKSVAGARCEWGTVLVWEPPSLVRFTWHPGHDPEQAQEIELVFTAEASGSRLQLTHTGWEKLGAEAKRARRAYPMGWTYELGRYAGRPSRVLEAVTSILMAILSLKRRFQPASARVSNSSTTRSVSPQITRSP